MSQYDHDPVTSFINRVVGPKVAELYYQDKKFLDLIAIALRCTEPDQPRVFKDGVYPPALQAWAEMGIPHAVIHTLLNDEGAWQYKMEVMRQELVDSLHDSFRFTDFLQKWAHTFQQVYEPVQTVLDKTAHSRRDGFNGHKFDRHIRDLIGLSQMFAQRTDVSFTVLEQNQYLLAVMLHDAGNGLNRGAHAAISVRLFELMFGEAASEVPELKTVMEAVMMHESKTALPVNQRLIAAAEENQGIESAERNQQFLESYAEHHSPIASLLRVVDKADVGFGRTLNTVEPTKGLLVRDPHFLLNIVFGLNREKFGYDPVHKDTFVVEFDFRLSPAGTEISPNAEFLVKKARTRNPEEVEGRREAEVPDEVRRIFKTEGTPYFIPLSHQFLHLYAERMELIALDVLNVLKNCNRVIIRLVDQESGRNITRAGTTIVNKPIEFAFYRVAILEDLQLFNEYLQAHPDVLSGK